MTTDYELIGVDTQDGPGDDYIVTDDTGEVVGTAANLVISGTYASVTGQMEIECTEWNIQDGRLNIEP